MPTDSSKNLQLPERNDAPELATIARDHSQLSTKGKYRLLIKDNIFLDLFALVFEDCNLKKQHNLEEKTSIILA